jgi:Tfp pilus assembly protein PilN
MEQQVNLYQPILGAEKRLFSGQASLIGLLVVALCLAGIAGFGAWHTTGAESAIARLEQQQGLALERASRADISLRPTATLPELDAQAHAMALSIAARERALEAVHRGAASPVSGFAARLEALAHRQREGLWLRAILLSDGHMAVRGGTTDPAFVPDYVSALSAEPALAGVQFDRLSLRRGLAAEAPARMVFELEAPGLGFEGHGARP